MHDSRVPPQQQTQQQGGQQGRAAPDYAVEHDIGGPARLSTTVAHAVSDASGANVTDVQAGINQRVNPAALDRMFRPQEDGTRRVQSAVSFPLWGYQVTIHARGLVVVSPPPAHGW